MSIIRTIPCLLFIMVAISACDSTQSARQSASNQYASDSQAKSNELQVASGDYTGTMHMQQSNQDFAVKLHLEISYDTRQSPDSQNPAETITVPKLSGSLSFPALDAATDNAYSNFTELLIPMGDFRKILFDYGDYNPSNQWIVLPYNVPGYSGGEFGELDGNLNQNQFSGAWKAKPVGTGIVGQFVLTRSDSTGAAK